MLGLDQAHVNSEISAMANWLKFWNHPWLFAHQSWLEIGKFEIAKQETVSINRIKFPPKQTRALLDIELAPPPEPGEALLNWISLDSVGIDYCLQLAAEVLFKGHTEQSSEKQPKLTIESKVWVRHIAKALIPGGWEANKLRSLTSDQVGLVLLRAWLSDANWRRACLRYPKSSVMSIAEVAVENIPKNRLTQLWYGVIWHAQQERAKLSDLSIGQPIEAVETEERVDSGRIVGVEE